MKTGLATNQHSDRKLDRRVESEGGRMDKRHYGSDCMTDSTYSFLIMHFLSCKNLGPHLGPQSLKNSFLVTKWWQERQGSNPRPSVLETDALPTELRSCEGKTRHKLYQTEIALPEEFILWR